MGDEAEAKRVLREEEAMEATMRDIRKASDPKFDGVSDNFATWKQLLLMSMQAYGLDHYFTSGALPAQTVNHGEERAFKLMLTKYLTRMAVVRAYFLRMLPLKYAAQVMGLSPTRRDAVLANCVLGDHVADTLNLNGVLDTNACVFTMFEYLCGQFEVRTVAERQRLWKHFNNIKMRDGDFEACYSEILDKSNQMSAAGQAVAENNMMSVLLDAMPESASQLVTSIQCEEEVTFEDAANRLRTYFKTQEVSKERFHRTKATKSTAEREDSVLAFKSTHKRFCHVCKKSGHSADKCWTAHLELRPKRGGETKDKEDDSEKTTPAKGPRCFWCQKVGHKQDVCRSKKAGKPKVVVRYQASTRRR